MIKKNYCNTCLHYVLWTGLHPQHFCVSGSKTKIDPVTGSKLYSEARDCNEFRKKHPDTCPEWKKKTIWAKIIDGR